MMGENNPTLGIPKVGDIFVKLFDGTMAKISNGSGRSFRSPFFERY